jgi:diadenosine tetraphosphate (Ap4A) HIT family hydrolase
MAEFLFKDEEIFRSQYFTVSQDWETPIPGFYIVSPRREVESIADLTDDEAIDFVMTTRQVRRGMKEVLGIENVYLFQNEDTLHNFHLWMFPRYEWMDELGVKIQSVRKIMNYAEEWVQNFDTDLRNAREMLDSGNDVISKVRASAAKMREYMGGSG